MALQMFMGAQGKGGCCGGGGLLWRQVAGGHSELIWLGFPRLLFMQRGLSTMGPGCVTDCSALPNK